MKVVVSRLLRVGFVVATATLLSAGSIATVNAQRTPPVAKSPARRIQPVTIFRLDAADAAPSHAELQNRMMQFVTASGGVMTLKANGVMEVDNATVELAITPEQLKAAEEKAKQRAEVRAKKVANRAQVEEDAKIRAAVDKTLAEDETEDKEAIEGSKKLIASLYPYQPKSTDGNVCINFISPKETHSAHYVTFRHNPLHGGQFILPKSYMKMDIFTNVGKIYLVNVRTSFVESPNSGVWVYESPLLGSPFLVPKDKQYLVEIEAGMIKVTSFVIKSEKEGWYPIYFAGGNTEWQFTGLTVVEITP